MPLKVNVGLSKKLGLPNYGSAGASCSVEFELDSGQLVQDLDGFHRNIRNAYGACRQAVQEELSRQLNPDPQEAEAQEDEAGEENSAAAESSNPAAAGSTTTPATLGLVHASPLASQRQLNYVHYLAHGLSGMTPRRLEILSATLCGKRLAHLTSADASHLIDTFKEIQAGEKDLSGVPREVSA
jgi:hypothetical protein